MASFVLLPQVHVVLSLVLQLFLPAQHSSLEVQSPTSFVWLWSTILFCNTTRLVAVFGFTATNVLMGCDIQIL
jgi:hypothetical protein